MNSSNAFLMNMEFFSTKTPAKIKKAVIALREKKITPAIKLTDLDALPETTYKTLKDMEARGEILVLN